MKKEESTLHQQTQTEHKKEEQAEDVRSEPHFLSEPGGDTEQSSNTDNDDNWNHPINTADPQMETEADGNHGNQVQTRDIGTATQISGQFLKNESVPETSAASNNTDTSGTDEGSEGKRHQCCVFEEVFE